MRALLVLFTLLLLTPGSQAALDPETVPEPLRPWQAWVLQGHEDLACPFLYNSASARQCAWPTTLSVEATAAGARFSQGWQNYLEGWLYLPGDAERWPQDVTLDGEPAVVVERNGRPAVFTGPGMHRLAGRFAWPQLPEQLAVPHDTGLVILSVDGRAITPPDLDTQGRLWLGERQRDASDADGDRLGVEVFRRVIDEVPLQVVTRIELKVSGAPREVVLGQALLADAIPVRLDSQLPARLEPDGRLRVQLRPGSFSIDLTSRHPGPVDTLDRPVNASPWPDDEVWVFDARPALRLVEIEGVAAVDPRQTNLPREWQQLPAYRLETGDRLGLETIRRGDPEPEPNRLNLSRDIWLDFDGRGYTVSDRFSGQLSRGWRLDAVDTLVLGRVSIDDQLQFITRRGDDGPLGVEVRRGELNLAADSRVEGDTRRLPAVGWQQDVQRLSATLHLPPGWTLLAASGVDQVPGTWLQRWTLLDLFVVLIAAAAVGRLWSWRWAALALVTLALVWHEPGAPRLVWLNLLVAIALLRVLPAGLFRRLITGYRHLSLLALVLVAVPFMVDQVRLGLYPQLERPGPMAPSLQRADLYQAAPQAGALVEESVRSREVAPDKRVSSLPASRPTSPPLTELDPDAALQTGPGLPQWSWTTIPLHWSGPVAQDQHIELTLLSPTGQLVLNALRVLLVLVLALRLTGWRPGGDIMPPRPDRSSSFGAHQTGAAAVLLLLGATTLLPAPVRAEIPDPALLEELRQRLIEPPACLPQCAQIPRMRLAAAPETLQLRLEIHALEAVAVPLPGQREHWLATRVLVDGQPATGLRRDSTGGYWLDLAPGRHQVLMDGPLPARDTLQLALPLPPNQVEAEARGWSIEGVRESGVPERQLQLTRIEESTSGALPALEPTTLPPFVQVTRHLRLGLDWAVETEVRRLGPPGEAAVLAVPLLPGESVITEGIRVEDRQVRVNLREGSLRWRSVLEPVDRLTLTAPDTTRWSEHWRADIGAIWHAELEGIPVVHHQAPGGQWLPEWRPWPGETVTLDITRPAGVPGPTLTIDESRLSLRPGRRATDASLELTLRSSRGGQHDIRLPEGVTLQTVTIDGLAQPIRQEDRRVTLPLRPGEQRVRLDWRAPEGIGASLSTPMVDLGSPSVNVELVLEPGRDRWVLWTRGPLLGPAVLFWGVLIVIIVLAAGLARVPLTPLRTLQWLLLGVGLSQVPIAVAVIVVGWLLALGARARLKADMDAMAFNAIQLGLGLLTLIALIALIFAVERGLLGLPEMQIAGNGSSAHQLKWYADRAEATLPQAWVFSAPLMVYRLLMLAWALWLAFALLGWLRWGWQCFSEGGLWKKVRLVEKKDERADDK
ncbi:MAG TPA: hypothetical protein ENN42_00340 [Thioalkalivibrio sp.]|nr:hypothetical protein [Thioalkalivibrio sp.]